MIHPIDRNCEVRKDGDVIMRIAINHLRGKMQDYGYEPQEGIIPLAFGDYLEFRTRTLNNHELETQEMREFDQTAKQIMFGK